jgi:pilin isopeptide linkage protein
MKLLQKSLLGLIVACMIIAFGGVIPAADDVSADSNDINVVSIPYSQIYDADSTRTDDTFKYRIVPVNGAPAPQESMNGVYYFNVKAKPNGQEVKGNVELRINFSKPGEYKYEVSSYEPNPVEGIKYDDTVYTAHVYVKNAQKAGFITQLALTANNSNGKKAALTFNPSYSAKAVADKERSVSSPDGTGQVKNLKKKSSANNAQTTAQNQTNQPNQQAQQNGNNDAAANDDTAAEEEPSALQTIRDKVLPKADPNRNYWSLVNLIAVILTVLLGLILFGRYMGRIDNDNDVYVIRREGKLRLLGIIPAVVSLIVFLCTEDFGDKMGYTDEWTPFMVIAAVVEIAICILVYKVYDGKNDRQIKSASA